MGREYVLLLASASSLYYELFSKQVIVKESDAVRGMLQTFSAQRSRKHLSCVLLYG